MPITRSTLELQTPVGLLGWNVTVIRDQNHRTLPNNRYGRYNVRTNVNYVANSKLNVDVGLGLTQSTIDLPDNDNNIFGWLGGGLLHRSWRAGVPVVA